MNSIKVEMPEYREALDRCGDLYYCRSNVYVLRYAGNTWEAVNIINGGHWSLCAQSREEAVRGLKKLPPGTVITITVEE